jgi:hypothetical protein
MLNSDWSAGRGNQRERNQKRKNATAFCKSMASNFPLSTRTLVHLRTLSQFDTDVLYYYCRAAVDNSFVSIPHSLCSNGCMSPEYHKAVSLLFVWLAYDHY